MWCKPLVRALSSSLRRRFVRHLLIITPRHPFRLLIPLLSLMHLQSCPNRPFSRSKSKQSLTFSSLLLLFSSSTFTKEIDIFSMSLMWRERNLFLVSRHNLAFVSSRNMSFQKLTQATRFIFHFPFVEALPMQFKINWRRLPSRYRPVCL